VRRLGHLRRQAARAGEFLDRRNAEPCETSEPLEQLPLSQGADPGDLVQVRPESRLPPQCPVVGQGKSVRLVSHLLEQVLASRAVRQPNRLRAPRAE
jgi:hypothetical protein